MSMRNLFLILLLFSFCSFIKAQEIDIKGVVKSATDNEPLIGVSVKVKNASIGTTTDLDGQFTLKASPDATLEFTYIGFKTQNIPVNGKKEINVLMTDDSQVLNEVIAVGYRTERKADLTGAVSVVKVNDMMSEPENNPIRALQGRVAGMEVTADGNPSGSATVRIRGIGTLNNNDPLYIIDGIPSQAGMHELNSHDIESIQVLRDASAASIYGSRAANGVIIITTKRGKAGVLKIDFDAFVSVANYNTKIDVLNSREYAQAMWQASVNSGIDPNSNNLGIVYKDGIGAQGNRVLENVYFPEYLDKNRTLRTSNTDWFDQITKTGVAQSYNLAVSNGTEKGSYYFSLGHFGNDALIKYTDFSRFSVRMNSDYKLYGDILTIGENFTLNRTSEVAQPDKIIESALIAVPFIPVHTADGTGWGGPITGLPDRQNPARLIHDNQNNRYRYWRMFGNAYVNLQPIKKLNIRSSFGLDYGNFYKRSLTHSYQSGYLESDRTASLMEQAHWTKWTWSNTATYDFEVGKNRFETLVGMEMFNQEDINFSAKREGFAVETPDYMWPDLGTGLSEGTGISTGYSLMSFFGKINYAYDDKYLASVTVRRDGSSRFGKNNRWGTFPAFNLGWRINQEAFMASTSDYLSDLKLRFGWGQNGNQDINNTAIYDIYVTDYGKGNPTWDSVWGTAYDLNGKGAGLLPSGFKRSQLSNPDLKWETTTQTNIGLDFGFFGQALYGSAEYYWKSTKDILYSPGYAAIKGEGANKWYNGASMENKGFEFTVGYRGKIGSTGVTYDVSGNISTNKNQVTFLPESVKNSYGGNGKWDNILGRPLGSFYGYVADGIFKSQEDLDKHAQQDGKDLGRIRYRDINNDGVINDDDRTWIGDPFPDFAYGLNLNFAYKNFDFIIFLQGIHNVDVINTVKYATDFWSVSDTRSNKGTRLLDAWDPITNPNSNIPRLSYTDTNNEARMSTYFVENGSYLKLRNVQVGYTLPKHIIQKIRLSRLRTYVSAQNLLTIKSKSFTGVDPENPAWGYPIPMTFTFGLNVSF